MASREELKIIATVKDEMTKELRGIRKEVRGIGVEAGKTGEKFKKAFAGQIKSALGPLVAFLGARAITRQFTETVDQVERLGLLADSIGSTVEQISALQFAFENVGLVGSDLETILTALERQRATALRGGGGQRDAFAQLGISLRELKQLDGPALFQRVFDGLKPLGNEFQQQAVLQTIWTENFRKLRPLAGGVLDELTQKAKDLGVVIGRDDVEAASKFGRELRAVTAEFTSVFRKLAVDVLPTLTEALEDLRTTVKALSGSNLRSTVNTVLDQLQVNSFFRLRPDGGIGPLGPREKEAQARANAEALGLRRRRGGGSGSVTRAPTVVVEEERLPEREPTRVNNLLGGLGGGFAEYKREIGAALRVTNELTGEITEFRGAARAGAEAALQLTASFESNLAGAFKALITDAHSASSAFRDFGRAILETVVELVAQAGARSLTKGLLGGLLGGLGGGGRVSFPGGSAALPAGFVPSGAAGAATAERVVIQQSLHFIDARDGQRFLAENAETLAALGIQAARTDRRFRDAFRLTGR